MAGGGGGGAGGVLVGFADLGSAAFLAPDQVSGIGFVRNRFCPDPGSQTYIFESIMTIFG